MALNLSTLTSSATSGDVLAEMLTTADFLEPVPLLKNLARGSNKGGDAKQGTALNQPKALPLIDGKGYLYCSGVGGNYALTPDDSSLDITSDLVIDVDVTMKSWTPSYNASFCGKYLSTGDQRSFRFLIRTDGKLQFYFSDAGTAVSLASSVSTEVVPFSGGQRGQVRLSFNSSNGILQYFTSTDKGLTWTQLGNDIASSKTSVYNSSADVYVGSYHHNAELLPEAGIHSVKFYDSVTPSSSSLRFNCDFTATNVRHNDTKFKCATGQTVTINQAGNDPATIIKKSVLRFDGVNDGLQGLFGQTITDGYMFAAFSVLGDGGEAWGRIISTNKTGSPDTDASGFIWALRHTLNNDLHYYYGGFRGPHHDFFDSDRGDYIHEVTTTSDSQKSKVNDADLKTSSVSTSLELQEFNIGAQHQGLLRYTAIDLEFLALFPASITDSQADRVRNYINNRNNVFDLKDGFGHYFYDAQDALVGAISTGSSSWNGRIVGSDNGDADKYATQGTSNDAPVGDGYVVTFADNTDHLDIPSTTQAGWQVVGTSLGTFAYKVNNTAVTELNLLGNLGNASYRKAGDLYGIILLPESATGKDIQDARKLLIDKGASDGVTVTNLHTFWYQRGDITQFHPIDTSGVTSFSSAWRGNNLTSFPLIDTSSGADFTSGWNGNNLTSFPLIDTSSGANFSNTWQGNNLTSFPLIDTSSGANFSSTWNGNNLTSFPLIDTSSGTNFGATWRDNNLTSFPLIDTSSGTSFAFAWRGNNLTSFPLIDTSSGTNFSYAWNGNNLTSFPLIDTSSGTSFAYAWNGNDLTSFPLIDTSSGTNFSNAWKDNNLTSFPLIDTSSVTTFSNAWHGNNLTSFPLIDTSSGANFASTWKENNLTSFPLIDTSSVTNFSSTWNGNNLTSFPLIDTSSGTNLSRAWYGNNLTSFPLIDTSSGTDFSYAWYGNNLTSFPLIDTSSGTTFYRAWRDNNLTSFPLIDTSSVTNFSQAWQGNNLTSFPLIDTSSVTNFSNAWNGNDLTSFPLIDTSSGTNFSNAWLGNDLTSFPLINTSSGTSFAYAWRDSNLTSFPANFFDSWNPASIAPNVFNLTWDGCTALTAQSVENILVSIDASGKFGTYTGASGGSALADAGIDIDYDGTTLSAATNSAVTSLKSKGWSIIVNNVTL